MDKYNEFWKWFVSIEEVLYKNIEVKADYYVPLIQEKLELIHEDLAFEISEILENQKREFILSADGIYQAFDAVIDLYETRPQMNRFDIVKFRQKEGVLQHSIELDGLTLSYDDIFFTYDVSEDVVLNVYIKGYDTKDNRYVHLYFLLLDSLLGEYGAVTKIDKTNVHPYTKNESLLPFIELLDLINCNVI